MSEFPFMPKKGEPSYWLSKFDAEKIRIHQMMRDQMEKLQRRFREEQKLQEKQK